MQWFISGGITFIFLLYPYLSKASKEGGRLEQTQNYATKKFLYDKMMRRVGKWGKTQKNWRVCSNHPVELLRQTVSFEYKGKQMSQKFELEFIPAAGCASNENPSNGTKGVGRYCLLRRHLDDLKRQINNSPPGSAERSAAEAILMAQQVIECHTDEKESTGSGCLSVLKAAGLSTSKMKSPQVKVKGKGGSPFGFSIVGTTNDDSSKPSSETMSVWMPPFFQTCLVGR